MGDVKRIERILRMLGHIWVKTPNQRFFQLLINYTELGKADSDGNICDPWEYTDEKLERDLNFILRWSK